MMKISLGCVSALAFLSASVAEELPITETDVFVQSGEVSESSIIIMARCNNEVDSKVDLFLNGEIIQEDQTVAASDYTISFKVEELESNTDYTYQVKCSQLQDQQEFLSTEGSFKTAPAADQEVPFNFVWVADLAGQGYGRNPDFEVAHVDGKTIKGGYAVFETMQALEPEFALFQGDMIYADGAIPPVKTIEAAQGVPQAYNWTNNPSKDFVAVTLQEFRDNWKYNFGDEKMQSFLAKVPIFVQWVSPNRLVYTISCGVVLVTGYTQCSPLLFFSFSSAACQQKLL
jgi:alkaline phosphatase D